MHYTPILIIPTLLFYIFLFAILNIWLPLWISLTIAFIVTTIGVILLAKRIYFKGD